MKLGCVAARRKTVALATAGGLIAILVTAFASPAEAARRKRSAPGGYNPPYAAMVVDVKNGRTLHAENEDALRHPASVTKVMTLYLLFEQLERGKLALDTPLEVSARAAAQAPSKLGLRPGSSIEVEDAIKALVTKSANDIAVVVAESIAGSEDAFAELMTRKARALGMSRTIYRNASGLPDPEQVTTARDLTILARAIQDRFPTYYRYFQTRVFHYAGASHANHNKLLGRVEGVDGIKTGFTRASGFNLMTNARSADRHIVAVVLGGRSGASRDQIMASLVRSNLPVAYAGARITPATGESSRPVAVAEAAPAKPPAIETTAATTPTATPAAPVRKPLDLNSLRPVVASAAGASSTTTPSTPLRWQAGPQPLPQAAQAFAAVQQAEPVAHSAKPLAKLEDRIPTAPPPAPSPAPASVAESKRDTPRAIVTGWVIQLGATDDEDKAKSMLDSARSRMGRTLSRASGFTEKVTKSGTTLYRARFSGFSEADEAQEACKALKRGGFACFATRG